MAYYLGKPIPKYYYDRIKVTDFLETEVDNFWNNTLPHYFTQEKFFGIEQEQRPLEGIVKQRADFTIRYVRNGNSKKFVLMESKRRGYESQTGKWSDAVKQLNNYLKLVRIEQEEGVLYGAVAVGTYVRFYILEPEEQMVADLSSADTGKAFELQRDEKEVHDILNDLVARTSH